MTTTLMMPPLTTVSFPDDVVEAFTEGDCWRLALAIERVYGYEMVFYGNKGELDNTWCHALNRLPDGRMVDINGWQTMDSLYDEYGTMITGEPVVDVEVDRKLALYGQNPWYPNYHAESYARKLGLLLGL